MITPRIEVDLRKVRQNTEMIVNRLKPRGIDVTGVTKAICGDPSIALAMLDGGAVGLAEARLRNVQRLRQAGATGPITLIRTPMLSQVDQVVKFCDTSYNTEISVIAALSSAALRKGTTHGIILMVEMGDLREGILPDNLGSIAQETMQMRGVTLKGIGANFACLSGVAPTAAQMAALSLLATEIEGRCGPFIQTISGGNSANLPWALSTKSTGRINDLRLGEAILLGVDPVTGERIENLHTDAFTLFAEVIETSSKPVPVFLTDRPLANLRVVSNSDDSARLILAIGRQDTDIEGLSMPAGTTLIGATSDHLVIGAKGSRLKVGSEMKFQMNYAALMHAMAAPDIEKKLLYDPSPKQSHQTESKVRHLSLV